MARGSLCRRAFDFDYGQIQAVNASARSEDVSDYIGPDTIFRVRLAHCV